MAEIRRRGIRAPRAYWTLRTAPDRLLGIAGTGPARARIRETNEPGDGEPRLPRPSRKTVAPVALFYAINGTGLGHLTRCLAIARHLEEVRPVFVTTSVRADVLDGYGMPYVNIPPFGATEGLSRARWTEQLHRTLNETFADHSPAVVVFDGVAPDPGFSRAIRGAPHIGRIGIRRAYRFDGRERLVMPRDAEMDLLLVPHERDGETVAVPEGPVARWVGSVCIIDRSEAMTRDDARATLGLRDDKPAVVVQLGLGAVGGDAGARARLVAALEALDVDVVTTSYARGGGDLSQARASAISRYPLAPLYPAFDLAIAAAGYNTFTELMHLGIPAVLIPNEHMRSDDQLARARRAERAGAAIVARAGDVDGTLVAARRLLADADERARMAEAGRALVPHNGATEAAEQVRALCARILAMRS